MRSPSVRSLLAPAVGIVAVIAALVWALSERGADERALYRDPPAAAKPREHTGAELVARDDPPNDPVPDAYAPSARSEAREQLKAEREAEPPEPEPPLPVFGSVLDELGRSLEGVTVRVAHESPPDPGRSSINGDVEIQITSGSARRLSNQELEALLSQPHLSRGRRGPIERTDANGAFELRGKNARDGGVLVFGEELYLGEAPRQAVIADGAQQLLLLPPRPAVTPPVIVHLTDVETGARVYPVRVEAELVALLPQPTDPVRHAGPLPPRLGRKCPRVDQVFRQDGRVELELWPGRWSVSLAGEQSDTAKLDLYVPLEGPPIEVDARVTVFAAADGWEVFDPAAGEELILEPDPSEGFDEYGPKHYHDRELGDRRSDGHFRRTLRFSPGTVRSARLELDLEAVSGMAHNDALGLEFTGGPRRFAFHIGLSKLIGDWRPPRRERIFLDLGDLPGKEGAVSLLSELADGRLDVYVQDDTAVHRVRVFVKY